MFALQLAAYAMALWLSCYLLARRPLTRSLAFSGLGLLAYAGALAADVLADAVSADGAVPWLAWLQWPLLFAPALCWCLALADLAPGAALPRWWGATLGYGAALVAGAVLTIGVLGYVAAGPGMPPGFAAPPPSRPLGPMAGPGTLVDRFWRPDWLYWALAGIVAVALLALLVQAVRARRAIPVPRARAITLISALFFGLGTGLLLLPVAWLPRPWLVLAIGADLFVFGWVVAALDAFDAGERLRADFVRSLVAALVLVAVFGGQVALALLLGAGPRPALTGLLLGVTAGAIALQAFWDPLQRALDRIVLGDRSPVGENRAALRAAASGLTRQPATGDVLTLPDEEFAAATRRALSHFGDLPKLAASPLTRLPVVDRRLASRGAPGDVLERAAELKTLLVESIGRLKPPGGDDFGTTDEWRHYNALYYPYVLGLKPYSRRLVADAPVSHAAGQDHSATAALRWLRTQVPERTLFNWQRAAAQLVAQDLRQRAQAAQAAPAAPAAPGPTGAGSPPAARETGELAVTGSGFPSHGSG